MSQSQASSQGESAGAGEEGGTKEEITCLIESRTDLSSINIENYSISNLPLAQLKLVAFQHGISIKLGLIKLPSRL
eukprot:2574925-Rhodomonas_salina.1